MGTFARSRSARVRPVSLAAALVIVLGVLTGTAAAGSTREMYADVLTIGSDGHTPRLSALAPAT